MNLRCLIFGHDTHGKVYRSEIVGWDKRRNCYRRRYYTSYSCRLCHCGEPECWWHGILRWLRYDLMNVFRAWRFSRKVRRDTKGDGLPF